MKTTWLLKADKCNFLTVGFNEPFPDFSKMLPGILKSKNVTEINGTVTDKTNLVLSLV